MASEKILSLFYWLDMFNKKMENVVFCRRKNTNLRQYVLNGLWNREPKNLVQVEFVVKVTSPFCWFSRFQIRQNEWTNEYFFIIKAIYPVACAVRIERSVSVFSLIKFSICISFFIFFFLWERERGRARDKIEKKAFSMAHYAHFI